MMHGDVEPASIPEEAQPGRLLAGKYRVEKVLGAGGMGVVVRAQHVTLGGRVALKFLHERVRTDATARARLLREAKAVVRIKNPHVATVSDVGELESGTPYIVMEYLEGRSLAALLADDGQLPTVRACDLALQVCEALTSAHAVGVIHRDVKPSNLFLTRDTDGSELLKVVDFGISKLLPPIKVTPLTLTDSTVGSPAFMSPEQMRSARNVDGRTDVWSVGVVLYLMLSGHRPFEAPSLWELCALVLAGQREPLSKYRDDLPEGLEQVIDRCIAPNLGDRFGDMPELAAALAPFGGKDAVERAERCRRIQPTLALDSTRPEFVLPPAEPPEESPAEPPEESPAEPPEQSPAEPPEQSPGESPAEPLEGSRDEAPPGETRTEAIPLVTPRRRERSPTPAAAIGVASAVVVGLVIWWGMTPAKLPPANPASALDSGSAPTPATPTAPEPTRFVTSSPSSAATTSASALPPSPSASSPPVPAVASALPALARTASPAAPKAPVPAPVASTSAASNPFATRK